MILSGYELMVKTFAARRPSLKNVWANVFPSNEPVPKSIIEISGAPGTGKSILLYELMARALLTEFYGGKNCQVVFLDLSHKFDFNVFVELVRNLMQKNSVISSQPSLENVVIAKNCESLICLPCYTADAFEYAFEEIENLLWDYKQIGLIAIDGLETFYWDECNSQLQRMATHYKKLVKRLKSICQEHNICCAYTVDDGYLATKSKPSAYFIQNQIDYKLKLKVKDGSYFLNDLLINVNYEGIQFPQNK